MNLESIKQLVEDVINGEESGLKAFALIKEQLKEVTDCLKAVEGYAMEEAEKYEKTFSLEGFQFEKRAGGRQFNFKTSESWTKKKAELSAVEERLKAAFNAYQNKLNTADENGELIELPEVTFRKDSLIVKRSN